MRRRSFLCGIVGIPAAILGSKLGQASKEKEDAAKEKTEPKPPRRVRIHCEEIIPYSWGTVLHNEPTIACIRRVAIWNTINTDCLPKVGSTLQIEQRFNDRVERFNVEVTKHEELYG